MKLTVLFLITAFTTATMAAGPVCKTIFASPEAEQQSVENTIKELSALRLRIDQRRAAGENSVAVTALDQDFHSKERALLEHLKVSNVMTSSQYVERMRIEIQQLQGAQLKDIKTLREEESRKKAQEAVTRASIKGNRAIFYRIEPGSFKMGREQVDVTLTEPFDMMETPTTQIIWAKVLELFEKRQLRNGGQLLNLVKWPSFAGGEYHPVENVSYHEVTAWLKALNELSQDGDPGLLELIPDHKKGDIYRLPTNAEWEFVARGRGQFNDDFFFGNEVSKLKDYMWYAENSQGVTHAVGEKAPLAFEGKYFYDMFGNVNEWMLDGYSPNDVGGVNPIVPTTNMHGSARGSHFGSKPGSLTLWNKNVLMQFVPNQCDGFRFIREVRKQ